MDINKQLAAYLENEGDYDGEKRISERAAELAKASDLNGLKAYARRIVMSHNTPHSREVRNALSEDDWGRIDWDLVAWNLRS